MKKKEVFIRENFWEDVKKSIKKNLHVIMIATKPDIIKQAPLYLELKKRGEEVILIHTGQHYDYNLSSGVLEEFGMIVDINLNISGKIYEKYAQIVEKLGKIFEELNNTSKNIIPYVHGDTMTATTADKAAFLNKIAVVHVEAGIRTLTPNKDFFIELFDDYNKGLFEWNTYYENLQDISIYELGSIEPFPEQFDTRGIEASAGYYAAPVELYKKTLINEGYLSENIEITGNTVVDAIEISKTKLIHSKAFELYPNMSNKPFIFITIHRRENTENKERFLVIYNAIKKLIQNGINVCFLGLHASESAINNYGLREDIEELKLKHCDNFAYGQALAQHSEVIDMISKAGAVVTDSGSMQEEANIVGVPCVTVRFGSDRAETILNGTNIIAPPINSNLIVDIVVGSIGNQKMKKKKHLYGTNVSKKIVDGVLNKLNNNNELFLFDEKRLGLEKYFNFDIS